MSTLAPSRSRWTSIGGLRRLALGLAALALVWLLGLVLFAESLPREAEDQSSETDAVVVLTGGSRRLAVGLDLLAQGRAKKLLISGVHPDVVKAELGGHEPKVKALLACCVVLGYAANDTIGNANETASWMAKEGFRSLRLVTSGYHMPRSLIEFRHALPGVTILAHPVLQGNIRQEAWWRWPGTAELIAVEFTKYILAWLRLELSDLAETG